MRSRRSDGRAGSRSPSGPDVDPAAVLAGQSLVCVLAVRQLAVPDHRAAPAGGAGLGRSGGPRARWLSEVDLFLRLCPAATVGVTGTKGKTTTASLAAAILGDGAAPVVLGGNIGIPLVERLPELGRHRVVLELSELQLPDGLAGDDGRRLHARHAGPHRPARIGGGVPSGEADPRRAGRPAGRARAQRGGSGERRVRGARHGPRGDVPPIPTDAWRRRRFGRLDRGGRGGATGGGRRRAGSVGPDGRVLPMGEIALPGQHNVSNVLAAVAVGLVFGIVPDAIRRAVAGFPGVEHRLEPVAEVDGVLFVNDSQGTQPDAVIAALRSFPAPLVLIAGGRSRAFPIDELARGGRERLAAAVLIGENAPELAEAFSAAGLRRIERGASMEDAVRRATRIARETTPSVVLLSPAAASFDMFRDYEARGAAFKAAVAAVAAEAVAATAGPAEAAAGPDDPARADEARP